VEIGGAWQLDIPLMPGALAVKKLVFLEDIKHSRLYENS
jgi:hypothetical protein